jgi:hypothetical protein
MYSWTLRILVGIVATGFGTECSGSMVFHDQRAPSGITCGTFDVLITGEPELSFRGFYDKSGNLTSASIRVHGHGLFINSVTGAALPFLGDGTDSVHLAVPGDFSSATETFSGPAYKVTVPGQGLIFLWTGRRVFEPNGEIVAHGPMTGSAELCAALS